MIRRPLTAASVFVSIEDLEVRLPQLWVQHQGIHISTLVLCGRSFVSLAGVEGVSWLEAAKKVMFVWGH